MSPEGVTQHGLGVLALSVLLHRLCPVPTIPGSPRASCARLRVSPCPQHPRARSGSGRDERGDARRCFHGTAGLCVLPGCCSWAVRQFLPVPWGPPWKPAEERMMSG